MRKSPAYFFATAPALYLTTAFATGIAFRLYSHSKWCWLLPMGFLGLACLRHINFVRWAIVLAMACLLGILRVIWAELPTGDNYRQFLPADLTSAELLLVIHDAPLLESSLVALDTGRGQVTADILAIQTISDDIPHPASGFLALTSPDWEVRQELRTLKPGDTLCAQGVLAPLQLDAPLEAIYSNYLRSRGVFHQFEVLEFTRMACPPPCAMQQLRLALRRLRVAIAKRLIQGIDSPDAARLALALGLGMSEFMPRESRQRQVVSGTIHVFAISGMHIGMVTLFLAFLLRWSGLPLKWQWWLLALLTAGYVLLTGSSISSLRALSMVWLALYATQRYRRAAWLNALGFAGGLALLISPWQLLDLGFLYSHLTVLVLLLSAPVVQCHSKLLAERNAWLPRELRPRHRTKLLQWFVGGLEVSLIAWLGNFGLAMHLNPQVSWGAPLLNLPLGILVALALALCPLRLLLGVLLPYYDRLWAATLELVLRLTEAVAESGHHSAFAYMHPLCPTWAMLCYYCGFFAILLYFYNMFNINKLRY